MYKSYHWNCPAPGRYSWKQLLRRKSSRQKLVLIPKCCINSCLRSQGLPPPPPFPPTLSPVIPLSSLQNNKQVTRAAEQCWPTTW